MDYDQFWKRSSSNQSDAESAENVEINANTQNVQNAQNVQNTENSVNFVNNNESNSVDVKILETVTEVLQENIVEKFSNPDFEQKPEQKQEVVSQPQPQSENKTVEVSFVKNPLLKEIFTHIPDYCTFGTYLKSISSSDADDIANYILQTVKVWKTDGKDKMFNIPDSTISVAILNDTNDPMTRVQRIESVGAQMFAAEELKWTYLQLFFNDDETLKRAVIEEISEESFSKWQWKIVKQMGYELYKLRQ